MTGVHEPNREPAAAEDPRAAVIAAAREVFEGEGFDAPLDLVARRAGVSESALRQHFRDRQAIAVAVFEDNIAGIEALAAVSNVSLDTVLSLMVDQIIGSIGFIVMVNPESFEDPRLAQASIRLRTMLVDKLAQEQPHGPLRPELTVDDLMLTLEMVASLLTRTEPDARPAVGRRAWRLVLYGLRTSQRSE